MQLSHEFAKNAFCPIAPDRIPESLADYNPYPTGGIIHLVRQEIKKRRRDSSPMTLDRFNIPASS